MNNKILQRTRSCTIKEKVETFFEVVTTIVSLTVPVEEGTVASSSSVMRGVFTEVDIIIFHEVWVIWVKEETHSVELVRDQDIKL